MKCPVLGYWGVVFVSIVWVGAGNAEPISLIISPKASSVERLAAEELAGYLARWYPDETFQVKEGSLESTGRRILLGTPQSAPALLTGLDRSQLAVPESYLVTTTGEGNSSSGVIVGADPSGVLRGVYGLLEKLGFGFYLDFETEPEPRQDAWVPEDWELADHPLLSTRVVFNWHNFLSGCTGWDYRQWEQWILGSQKIGFNTIMVHAYGNNPMFTFSFTEETRTVTSAVAYAVRAACRDEPRRGEAAAGGGELRPGQSGRRVPPCTRPDGARRCPDQHGELGNGVGSRLRRICLRGSHLDATRF